jgi:hypothetical protein
MNNMEKKKKNLLNEIKELSQEYHSLKANIQKLLRYINEKKIYVNFVNKLLGGESKIGNLNLDDINIQKMEDSDLHFLIVDIEVELKKNNIEDNIFITATDEEIAESINKIDIVFKILEDRILKTLSNRENIRQEIIEIKNDQEKIRKELESRLLEVKEEYQNTTKDYEGEEDNNYFKLDSPEEYNIYVRDLLKDFYGYLNKDFVKKKEEIDEYNFIDKVVKPTNHFHSNYLFLLTFQINIDIHLINFFLHYFYIPINFLIY